MSCKDLSRLYSDINALKNAYYTYRLYTVDIFIPAKPLDWKKQLCFQKTCFFANSVEKSALEHFLPFEAILGSLGYIISNLR